MTIRHSRVPKREVGCGARSGWRPAARAGRAPTGGPSGARRRCAAAAWAAAQQRRQRWSPAGTRRKGHANLANVFMICFFVINTAHNHRYSLASRVRTVEVSARLLVTGLSVLPFFSMSHLGGQRCRQPAGAARARAAGLAGEAAPRGAVRSGLEARAELSRGHGI